MTSADEYYIYKIDNITECQKYEMQIRFREVGDNRVIHKEKAREKNDFECVFEMG